jgi:hypothetical protein
MKIMGLDPGGTTGVAIIEITNKVPKVIFAKTTKDPLLRDIRDLMKTCDIIVYEGWWTRKTEAETGAFNQSTMIAPQVIGTIETLIDLYEKKGVKQQPAIKPMGYGYSNLTYVKGKPGMHSQDAIAHAMYFAVTAKLSRPILQ